MLVVVIVLVVVVVKCYVSEDSGLVKVRVCEHMLPAKYFVIKEEEKEKRRERTSIDPYISHRK